MERKSYSTSFRTKYKSVRLTVNVKGTKIENFFKNQYLKGFLVTCFFPPNIDSVL